MTNKKEKLIDLKKPKEVFVEDEKINQKHEEVIEHTAV